MKDLAKRLVEHPKWEWQPGMMTISGWMRGGHGCDFVLARECVEEPRIPIDETPDIEHPATKGWLLAMLRGATHDMTCVHVYVGSPVVWGVFNAQAAEIEPEPTEGEALAAALLAVWGTP